MRATANKFCFADAASPLDNDEATCFKVTALLHLFKNGLLLGFPVVIFLHNVASKEISVREKNVLVANAIFA